MFIPYGNTVPRIFTPPLAVGPPAGCPCGCGLSPVETSDGTPRGAWVRGTSWGFSAIEFAEQVIGMKLHPWQRWLNIHALECRPRSIMLRYRFVLVLIARQNGKTSIVEIKNLWKLFVLQVPLVIATAQNLDVAEESWDKAVEIIEGTPELAAELEAVVKVNGKKSFKLRDGQRWKVQAANRRGGRGLSAEDVNLDELREHQKWDAWGAVTKTTTAREDAQIWSFSNAGDDSSIVLNDQQAKGRAAAEHPDRADPAIGHFEWSAPDETRCTCGRTAGTPHYDHCLLLSREVQAMANPSAGHPYGIPWDVLRTYAQGDRDEIYLTEHLCVRVADLSGKSIDPGVWRARGDAASRRAGPVALSVDISADREWSAICLYGIRADGLGHLQVLDYLEGTARVMDRLDTWRRELGPDLVAVGMLPGTHASLQRELTEGGYLTAQQRKAEGAHDADLMQRGDVIVLKPAENAAACGQIIDAVRQDAVRHVPAAPSEAAVLAAKTRKVGDTVAWAPRDNASSILALTGMTTARYAYYARIDLALNDDYDPVQDIG